MLSIIVPVYNEEELISKNISTLIKYADSLKEEYEILICNNGSTDSTVEKGKSLAKKYNQKVRFFSIPEKGVGGAFKKAVKESSFDNLVAIDLDLTTDLKFIEEALELLKKYDIVIGSKQVGEQQRSGFRVFISSVFIFLVRRLLGLKFSDYSIGAKAYKKKLILKWLDRLDNGSSYVIELIFYAKENKNSIVEIPVICDDRRKSRFNLVHEIVYRFVNLLKIFIRRVFSKKR